MLSGIHNIHFIGIGGAGMSALAHVLCERGFHVSGSDKNAGGICEKRWEPLFIRGMLPGR